MKIHYCNLLICNVAQENSRDVWFVDYNCNNHMTRTRSYSQKWINQFNLKLSCVMIVRSQ